MKRWIAFICLLAFLGGCSSVPLTGRKQLLLVSDQEVLSASLTQYSDYMKTAKKSSSGKDAAMVTRVGKKIAAATEQYLRQNGMQDEIKNFMGREDINPALELILVLVTCNIYSLYWYYKYGKIVYLEMTSKVGMDNSEDSTVLLVILGLLVYVVAGAIMQDKLNAIWNSIDDSENATPNAENN